jgi:hypothetical protein
MSVSPSGTDRPKPDIQRFPDLLPAETGGTARCTSVTRFSRVVSYHGYPGPEMIRSRHVKPIWEPAPTRGSTDCETLQLMPDQSSSPDWEAPDLLGARRLPMEIPDQGTNGRLKPLVALKSRDGCSEHYVPTSWLIHCIGRASG